MSADPRHIATNRPDPTSGQVLLVTGGSRGIGAAVVARAARDGYRVCFSYSRSAGDAARCVEGLHDTGAAVVGVRADVRDPAQATRLFDVAERELGPVDAVVSNAGVTGRLGPFAQTSLDDLRQVLDVNVLGSMLIAQEAVRRWQQRPFPGVLVNISSVAARLGAPGEYVHYAASKAAVDALTIGLAKECATAGIRVNAVSPGTVHTGIHAAAGEPDRPARVAARIPLGRAGQPEEIAAAVAWLLSAEASYVTGVVLDVSGGL